MPLKNEISQSESTPLKLVFVNNRDIIESRVRDVADERMTESVDNMRGVKGFFQRIWKHNLAREYYRQKEVTKARQEILASENLFVSRNIDQKVTAQTKSAIVERFLSEYEEVIHAEAGESRTFLTGATGEISPEQEKFLHDIKILLKRYATNEIDIETVISEKRRLLQMLPDFETVKSSVELSDNFLQVAENIKVAVEHGESIEQLDSMISVTFGQAATGVRTESNFSSIDKLIEKVKNTKVGSFVNETTIASAVAIAHTVGVALSDRLARSQAIAWGTLGFGAVVGGAIAGLQESYRFKSERRQHAREKAQGAEFSADAERRHELDSVTYDTVSVKQKIESLREFKDNLNKDNFELAVAELAAVNARVQLSDTLRVDLLHFSDITSVESERTALDIARAELKIALKNFEFESGKENDFKQQYDTVLETVKKVLTEGDRGIAELDRMFNQMRQARVAKVATKATLLGLTIGATAQEGLAFINDSQVGLVESLTVGNQAIGPDKVTALEGLRAYVFGNVETPSSISTTQVTIGDSNLFVPEGATIDTDPTTGSYIFSLNGATVPLTFETDGSLDQGSVTALSGLGVQLNETATFNQVNIERPTSFSTMQIGNNQLLRLPTGVVVENTVSGYVMKFDGHEVPLHFNSDGSLAFVSLDALRDLGVYVTEDPRVVTNVTSTVDFVSENRIVQPEQFISSSNLFVDANRNFWYDNNTPSVFDRNELRLEWGEGGSGVDANGNYVLSVANMEKSGSFFESQSIDAQQAISDGKLTFLLSLSESTQDKVIEIPINADGRAVIDPDSEIGKLLFTQVDGKANFLGKFIEVAETNPDGSHNILATHVGNGLETVQTTVVSEVISPIVNSETVFETSFDMPETQIAYDTSFILPPQEQKIDPFYAVPIMGRRPLESKLANNIVTPSLTERYRRPKKEIGFYYMHAENSNYGLLQYDNYDQRFLASLQKDPDFDTIHNDRLLVTEYIQQQNPEYIAELAELIRDQESIDDETEVFITIPAYKEGKNLEKTIRNYAKLKNRNKFELVILENHPVNVPRDNSADVIAAMRKEFPDMKITHLHKVFPEKPAIGNVRKYLVDSILLRKSKNSSEKSHIIVSNDADLEDISENYVQSLISAFADRGVDAVGAKWDFPVDDFKKFPLLHATQRLWQYFDIVFRHNVTKSAELIGRNSAFRSGIYAAIGGYNEKATLAEDLEIGWLIKKARNYKSGALKYRNSAWLKSNGRRAILKVLGGGNLIEQYGDFHTNEKVRDLDVNALLETGVDFSENELNNQVNAIWKHYNKMKKSNGNWCDDADIDATFDRAMSLAGINYMIDQNQNIVITNVDKLKRGLFVNAVTTPESINNVLASETEFFEDLKKTQDDSLSLPLAEWGDDFNNLLSRIQGDTTNPVSLLENSGKRFTKEQLEEVKEAFAIMNSPRGVFAKEDSTLEDLISIAFREELNRLPWGRQRHTALKELVKEIKGSAILKQQLGLDESGKVVPRKVYNFSPLEKLVNQLI